MTDRSNYQRVGIETDEQSFDRLIQRVNVARDTIAQLKAANQSVADSADVASSRLQKAFSSTKDNIESDIQSVQKLRSQLTGAADDASNLGKQTSSGSGSGFGVEGLRRTGGALTQLGLGEIGQPIQRLGDLGQITKEVGQLSDALTTTAGATEPLVAGLSAGTVALGALAAAGAIFVGGLALIHSAYEDNTRIVQEALTQLDTYYAAISKGTTDSLKVQLKAAEDHKKSADDELSAVKNSQDRAFQAASKQYGDLGARLLFAAGQTGLYGDTLKDTGAKQAELSKKSSEAQGQIDALNMALGSTSVAANDAAAAEEKLQAARDSAAEKHIQQVTQTAQLEASGTTKQIQDRLAAIKVERDAINDQIHVGNLSAEETAKLDQRFHDLTDEMERDEKVIGPLIAARERQTAADKDATKAAQDRLAADKKRDQDSVAAFDKYTTAVQSAEDSAATARLNANQKLQDALVSAAEKAVDDANKALDQLTQKRQENLTSFTRDEEKATRDAADQQVADQIKAQRQERDDLQTHLDNLKQIRDRDAGRERDDLLNRNYRDLFSLGEQKKQDLTTENDRYNTQAQQRNQALQDEQSDQARAIQVQRRERLISYQQANADALKQYNIEIETAQHAKAKAIQLAQQGYQKELVLINQNLGQKEKLLRQDAINEIKLVQQTEDQKMTIFKSKLQQVNDLLGVANTVNNAAATHSGTSTHALPFAEVGYASAGQLTKVNDGRKGQRESFNGTPFPPGLGLFIPAHSGYIDSGSKNSGPITLSPVYQITGVDAKQVVEIADARNRKLMKDVGLIK